MEKLIYAILAVLFLMQNTTNAADKGVIIISSAVNSKSLADDKDSVSPAPNKEVINVIDQTKDLVKGLDALPNQSLTKPLFDWIKENLRDFANVQQSIKAFESAMNIENEHSSETPKEKAADARNNALDEINEQIQTNEDLSSIASDLKRLVKYLKFRTQVLYKTYKELKKSNKCY